MAAPVLAEKSAKYETISNEIVLCATSYLGVLEVAITNQKSEFKNSPIQYGRSNMTGPILVEKPTKNETISNNSFSRLRIYSGIFAVAGHEYKVKILKFANPKWWI